MSNIKWGDTHCPVCEKKFAKDADYDEGYRLEQTYGVDSQPVQEFDARLCWADCYDFDTILKRLGELLTERDMLRAEVARLRNELDEIRLAYTDIMNEPCEDEVHCTCVPGLRAEIVKWIAANNAATTIINEQQAEIECLRRMIQR
jgi:hypothetical protein